MDARLKKETMQGSRTETSFRNWTRLVAGRRKKETAAAATIHSRSTDRAANGRSTGERGKRSRSIHLRHPATSRFALPTICCLSAFSKHRTVDAALLDRHTKALVALFNFNISTCSSILSPSGSASIHLIQRQLSSLQINLPRASSTIWRLRWAPHALFSPDCQFTETFSSPPPTFSCWLNKRHLYNAYSTLASL